MNEKIKREVDKSTGLPTAKAWNAMTQYERDSWWRKRDRQN